MNNKLPKKFIEAVKEFTVCAVGVYSATPDTKKQRRRELTRAIEELDKWGEDEVVGGGTMDPRYAKVSKCGVREEESKPEYILREVRKILNTPEMKDVREHAWEIMQQLELRISKVKPGDAGAMGGGPFDGTVEVTRHYDKKCTCGCHTSARWAETCSCYFVDVKICNYGERG